MTVSVAVEVEDVATETVRALDDDPAATLTAATATAPSGASASSPLDAGIMATGTGTTAATDGATTTDGADAIADASVDTDIAPRL